MWFLSQEGQQFGPYSTSQLLELVTARRAHPGWVCAQGETAWVPIEQHPTFAAAVTRAMGSAAKPGPNRAPVKRIPAWPFAIAGLMLVVTIVAGIAQAVRLRSPGALARFLPSDTTTYIEVSDLSGMLDAMLEMGILEQDRIDEEHAIEEVVEGLRDAFETDEDTAQAVLEDVRALALARRGTDDKGQTALVIEMSATGAMEDLLETKRFDREETIGDSGHRYSMRRSHGSGDEERWSSWHRLFANVEADRRSTNIMAWLPEQRLLVVGHEILVEDVMDVIDDGEKSLADTEAWNAAIFLDDAHAVAYVDPTALLESDDTPHAWRELFEDATSLAWSMEIDEDGTLSSVRGELDGPGVTRDPLPEPAELTLPRRLPAATVAYVVADPIKAFTDGPVSAALRRTSAAGVDHMAGGLLGLCLSTLWNHVDGEVLVAITASKTLRLDPGSSLTDQVDGLAMGLVMRVSDREVIAQQLRTMPMMGNQMGLPFRVTAGETGMELAFDGQVRVSLRMELLPDDLLVVALGGDEMVDEFIHAVKKGDEGERLAGDPAHERVFTTFSPNARALVWFDTARMLQILPAQDTPELLLEMGISRRALAFEGEHRITYAAALVLDQEDGALRFEGKLRNGDPLLATIAAGSAVALVAALERIVEHTQAAIAAQWMGPQQPRGLW